MKKRQFTNIIVLSSVFCLILSGCSIKNDNSQKINESEVLSETENIETSENEISTTTTDVETSIENTIMNGSVEFLADITHDGTLETIKLTVEPEIETYNLSFSILKNDDVIYLEEDIPVFVYSLGVAYYLYSTDEGDYLMYYHPYEHQDEVSCEYKVFYINENGETIDFDNDRVELYLNDADVFSNDNWVEEWITYAEKENLYFENSILLYSTLYGELHCGGLTQKNKYQETFDWLFSGSGDSLEENLSLFPEHAL